MKLTANTGYKGVFGFLIIMFMVNYMAVAQSCPSGASYSYEAGSQVLEVEITGNNANLSPETGSFGYHLFEYNQNGYVYNPLDLGGDEIAEISMEYVQPNTLRFTNVPEGNYTLVLTGGECSGAGQNFTELKPENELYFSTGQEE